MIAIDGGDVAAIIAATASLVAAVGSTLSVLMSLRNGRKIEQVHQATNGMKAELVKVTGEAKFAEGLKQGEENQRRG